MSGHTPGPWTAVAERGSTVIVTPLHGNTIRLIDDSPHNEADANARLIAAGPELLAALKALMAAYESVLPGIRHIAVKDYKLVNDAPVAAERAIAKAEGRS